MQFSTLTLGAVLAVAVMALPAPQSPSNNSPPQPQANSRTRAKDLSLLERVKHFLDNNINPLSKQVSENFAHLMNSVQGAPWFGTDTTQCKLNQAYADPAKRTFQADRKRQAAKYRAYGLKQEPGDIDALSGWAPSFEEAQELGLFKRPEEFGRWSMEYYEDSRKKMRSDPAGFPARSYVCSEWWYPLERWVKREQAIKKNPEAASKMSEGEATREGLVTDEWEYQMLQEAARAALLEQKMRPAARKSSPHKVDSQGQAQPKSSD